MHTTTVRFDSETWPRLKRMCEELGIPTADYIRVATIQRMERSAFEDRLALVEARQLKVEGGVEGLTLLVEELKGLVRRLLDERRRR
jgi:predicted DNA-binding protein